MSNVVQINPCADAATGLRNIADMIETGELDNVATVICGTEVFVVGEFDDARAAEQAVFDMTVGTHKLMKAVFDWEC